MWVIKRKDTELFIRPAGSESTTTKYLQEAVVYRNKSDAVGDCCYENEVVVPLEHFLIIVEKNR